ncbi:sigma 54-interacting transcriptional regulator [Rhodopirellula sp. MGV]|uniref:sigma-54-dependent Fis family transcriptional regulator n=1 Tax=Rhodopirellula sp. MGV TaxID=2023130 RepID=UPI000B95E484|nr:sigma 54-interacting transcriptional regulator [Rhodopirellula sp. MGV]OYP31612.1 hydrogenase [Rhodopirellula sp. MGV]PNY36333.1 hydrogenase [Rhodopirellula baltica]PNY37758.1 hydrogenase [Rhodopirellula baltica]
MGLDTYAVFGDPKEILLAISGKHHLPELLPLAVQRLGHDLQIALVRIWLTKPPRDGDCDRCSLATECRDRRACLHLAASFGNSRVDPDQHWQDTDGSFRRMPMGVRKVGQIAATGEPIRINIGEGSDWIVDPAWVESEGIVAFQGMPLRYRDETLGVLGIFSRVPIGPSCDQWLMMISDQLAAAISSAQAVDEIESLRRRLELENEYLREEVGEVSFGELVGQSAALQTIVRQIDLVAPTDSSVLVLGESGTGKELIAREVHRRSDRCDRPLIKVNCAAIPRELYESEFFGHSKGSFTGALRDRAGRFELADGGTLFLDEVGEIPLDLQSKLLRVLQEGELERVGEERTRRVNVRIIAATNRDLRNEAIKGRFRQDLYYRLSVFPIELAPLRMRSEDIPLLAKHFLRSISRKLGRKSFRLTLANVQQLQRYNWPGNIRELQHVLERSAIVSIDGKLRFDLHDDLSELGQIDDQHYRSNTDTESILTEAELIQLQINNIRNALRQCAGKIYGPEGAAAVLGLKPTTLASRMRKLNVSTSAQ